MIPRGYDAEQEQEQTNITDTARGWHAAVTGHATRGRGGERHPPVAVERARLAPNQQHAAGEGEAGDGVLGGRHVVERNVGTGRRVDVKHPLRLLLRPPVCKSANAKTESHLGKQEQQSNPQTDTHGGLIRLLFQKLGQHASANTVKATEDRK